ncbi:MAG: M23 family metallopeptidase [Flavipsychrobacter sp.]
MKRIRKYYYNTDTHRFEKLEVAWHVRLFRIIGFLSASIVSALIIVSIAYKFFPSPNEKELITEIEQLKEEYIGLQNQLNDMDKELHDLEYRDNDIYRTVFESEPIPDSIRIGKQYSAIDPSQYAYINSDKLIETIQHGVDALRNRVKIQKSSYDTLEKMVQAKENMLKSIPAIQPVSNRNLKRVASGFGYRIDPIYKTPKLHTGLDFTAASGTPIYATGNGLVEEAVYDHSGYGRHVIINHGYGYKTLYAHMVKIKVRDGTRVRRGQIIGWVGSSGKSTGPHLHYEVIKNGKKINPINFFFNDLTSVEYERLVKISASSNQSFD